MFYHLVSNMTDLFALRCYLNFCNSFFIFKSFLDFDTICVQKFISDFFGLCPFCNCFLLSFRLISFVIGL